MGLFSKTRTAKFWGAGDSQICCSGIDCEDNEFTTYNHPKMKPEGYVATLSIVSGNDDQGLLIYVHYTGHWSFAISPSNIDIDKLPDWGISREWGTVNSHSETLSIECPKGSKASVVERFVEE